MPFAVFLNKRGLYKQLIQLKIETTLQAKEKNLLTQEKAQTDKAKEA